MFQIILVVQILLKIYIINCNRLESTFSEIKHSFGTGWRNYSIIEYRWTFRESQRSILEKIGIFSFINLLKMKIIYILSLGVILPWLLPRKISQLIMTITYIFCIIMYNWEVNWGSECLYPPWRKYRIGIHSKPIRTIPISVSEPIRIIPNQSEKRFVTRLMKNGKKVFNPINPSSDWSKSNFQSESIRMNPRSEWFELILIKNSVWINPRSNWLDWSGFIRIVVSD